MTVAQAPLAATSPGGIDWRVAGIAGGALLLGGILIGQGFGARQGLLLLLGGGLGLALYHAGFGFTAGWRNFIRERRSAGLRAQFALLALATVTVLPAVTWGELFAQPVVGSVSPLGVSLLVGAALFGFGMQLGGGCGSGTLYTVGGGNIRMLVTLAAFIAGATIATAHVPWWEALPAAAPVALGDSFGAAEAVLIQLLALAGLYAATLAWEKRRHGSAARVETVAWAQVPARLLTGPWPPVWGAAALAMLSLFVLAVAGHSWSVTFAFGLWGAKLLAAIGVPVGGWEFWTWPYPAQALSDSVFANTVSVMDFGLILGALLGAGLAGKFAPSLRIAWPSLAAAIIGGLLMGYGARLSYGCNVGALLAGIASGSLHGWVWFAAAFIGSIAGVRLRPSFGLDPR